jgi:hypothetical protein
MGWMGPVVDGQEHEGWVVPLFADGAQGAGTSSDRVRLTYRDGSTAEGLWQDSTLIRGDGLVHAHTGGQVRLEVIDQAEEWRPDAAVVGWAAGCTCGCRGTPGPAYHRSWPTRRPGDSPPPAGGPIWRPPTRTG